MIKRLAWPCARMTYKFVKNSKIFFEKSKFADLNKESPSFWDEKKQKKNKHQSFSNSSQKLK